MSKNKIEKPRISIHGNVLNSNIILGNNNVINTVINASSEPEKVFQLRPVVGDFTGREQEIKELLYDSNFKNEKVLVINGMGGVGKTELALAIAHEISSEYQDGQIYFNLRGLDDTPATKIEIMRHVILSLVPLQNLDTDNEVVLSGKYFSAINNRKLILFFDNAVSAEQIQDLLPPKSCVVIITSRNQFALSGITTYKVLYPFSDDGVASTELLLKIYPDTGEYSTKIVNLCGHLPLAIRIAGSFLVTYPEISPEQYAIVLEKLGSEILVSDDNSSLNVRATISMSIKKLSKTEMILLGWLSIFKSSFTAEAALSVWGNLDDSNFKFAFGLVKFVALFSKINFRKYATLSTLMKFRKMNLIFWDNGRYYFHDLVLEYLTNVFGLNLFLGTLHGVYYSKLVKQVEEIAQKEGSKIETALKIWDQEWLQIEAGQKLAVLGSNSIMYQPATEALVNYATAINCVNLRLSPEKAIVWVEDAIRAVNRNNWGRLFDHNLRGLYISALFSATRFRWVDKFREYSDLLLTALQKEKEDVLSSLLYSLLGFLSMVMGYTSDAEGYARKSSDILANCKLKTESEFEMAEVINVQNSLLSGDVDDLIRGRDMYAKMGNFGSEAALLMMLAFQCARNGEFEKSYGYLSDAEKIVVVLNSTELDYQFLMTEVKIKFTQDDYIGTIELCKNAEKRIENETNQYLFGDIYKYRGWSYYFLDDYIKAEQYLKLSQTIFDEYNLPIDVDAMELTRKILDDIEIQLPSLLNSETDETS